MEHLKEILSNRDSRSSFEEKLHQLLRLGDVSRLMQIITQGFEHYPCEFGAICKDINSSSISLMGWDEMIADMVEFEATENRRIKPEDLRITALGIDIVGGNCDEGEPDLEVSFYNDIAYPFSEKTVDEISFDYTTEHRPWEDGFMECNYSLKITGFRNIIKEQINFQRRNPIHMYPNAEDFPGRFLSNWFIYLHVYEVLKTQIKEIGLQRVMPVIFSQNEFGPHFGVVFEGEKIADYKNRTLDILEERRRVSTEQSMAKLAQNVESMRSNRDFMKTLPMRWFQNDVQKKVGDSIVKDFKCIFDHHKLEIPKPLNKMTDRQFEKAISDYEENWQSKIDSWPDVSLMVANSN